MAVFAIGDLHLSLSGNKPMDVFYGWQDYVAKLCKNWQSSVSFDDTVILAGDISWAMHLRDCGADFKFINDLPGKKYLIKGNHDYWWSTAKKMNDYFCENNFNTLNIMHNNCAIVGKTALCGTRSWLFEGAQKDTKVINREVGRLKASLLHAENLGAEQKIVFLHYPPISAIAQSQEIIEVMQEHNVKRCYYGHLHGTSIKNALQGNYYGIDYKLISADAVNFCPVLIEC